MNTPNKHGLGLKIVTAEREWVCDRCKGAIPRGHRYWKGEDGMYYHGYKEHTNCEHYKPTFNHVIQ